MEEGRKGRDRKKSDEGGELGRGVRKSPFLSAFIQ